MSIRPIFNSFILMFYVEQNNQNLRVEWDGEAGGLEAFEGEFDELFEGGGWGFLEDGGDGFGDVWFGETEHDEGGGGFVDSRV